METDFLEGNIFFVLAAIVSGGMLLWPLIVRNPVRDVDPQGAVRLINYENALVLDVRDDSEFAKGHVPNATHIPMEHLKERWTELEKYKEKPIVIVFKPKLNSGLAGSILRKNGFKQVFRLNGGIESWEREKMPLVKK